MKHIELILEILKYVIVAAVFGLGGYLIRKRLAEAVIGSAEEEAKRILQEAEKDAEAMKREALLEAKEEIHKLRADQEREGRERRSELQQLERRLVQKEESLDRKSEALERREASLQRRERETDQLRAEIEATLEAQRQELERLSGLTSEQARELILKTVEDEIRHETAIMIREIETEAKKKLRNVLATSFP